MSFCKSILLLIILVSGPFFLKAQEIQQVIVQKVDVRIPYRKHDGSDYTYGNSILREMAKFVLREPWLVRIQVVSNLSLTVFNEAGKQYLEISASRPQVFGDTIYRNFPIGDVLAPSRISLNLKWANKADTTSFAEQSIARIPLSFAGAPFCRLPVTSYDQAVDTLLIRDIEFFYDTLSLQKFNNRIELIHDYFAAGLLLDSLQLFTAQIHPDDVRQMPYNYLKIAELARATEQVASRNFPGELLLNGYDPAGLMKKYQESLRSSRSLLYNFIDALHKTRQISWDGDAGRLSDYFTARVYSYVKRSYLMDQQHGLIYGDCLNHFFERDAFPENERVLHVLLSKMYPDARPDTLPQFITRRIYASYQGLAQQLMTNGDFAAAFSVLDNGRRLVAACPGFPDPAADDGLISRAAQGICDAYTGIALTCIRNRKYDMADTYLARADEYAVKNAVYVRSDSLYRAVFSELFFLRNSDCDLLLSDKKYQDALDCYALLEDRYSVRELAAVSLHMEEKKSVARAGLGNLSARLTEDALARREPDTALFYYDQARSLLRQADVNETVENRLDSLAPAMTKIRFLQVFREGALALEKRQYTLAVSRLKEAKVLAKACSHDPGREFDSSYRQAMKFYLIVQLSSSQKKIWANQFDSAQLALQRTEEAGFDFGLLSDVDFTKSTDQFKRRIEEQKCRNLQDSVSHCMIRADRAIALKSFVKAIEFLQEALVFTREMPPCGFTEQPVLDTLAKYSPPATYQRNQMMAGRLVAAGAYDSAVVMLIKNQQAFTDLKLERFGIRSEGVSGFIRDRNNPYLTEKAVEFYAAVPDNNQVLGYLKMAHAQGGDRRGVEAAQTQSGQYFARQDYLANTNSDPKVTILKLVPDEAWFSAFRTAYFAEWARSEKERVKGSK